MTPEREIEILTAIRAVVDQALAAADAVPVSALVAPLAVMFPDVDRQTFPALIRRVVEPARSPADYLAEADALERLADFLDAEGLERLAAATPEQLARWRASREDA